ncbi:MAG: hypothetical protein AAFW60_04705, partial [Pseudomonadota bacterium]
PESYSRVSGLKQNAKLPHSLQICAKKPGKIRVSTEPGLPAALEPWFNSPQTIARMRTGFECKGL